MLVVLAVASAACGRIGFDASPEVELAMRAGAAWNDYVRTGTTTPCPIADRLEVCEHAGEVQRVDVAGVTSCARLVLEDELGVFEWTCAIEDGHAVFTSALLRGRGLRDLVTAAGWRENRVVLSGAARGETEPAVWWPNPVEALPDNSAAGSGIAVLAAPGTIYVVPGTRGTEGIRVAADRIGLVTLGTEQLIHNRLTGNASCILEVNTANGVWIEAAVDAGDLGERAICLRTSGHAQVHASRALYGGYNQTSTISLDNVTRSRFRDVRVSESGSFGIMVGETAACDDNLFEDLVVDGGWNSFREAIYVRSGTRNVFVRPVATNNQSSGILLGSYCDGGDASGNTVTGARVTNNEKNGVYVTSTNNVVTHTLALGNGGAGVFLSNNCGYAHGTKVSATTAAFNGGYGVLSVTVAITVENAVAIGNSVGVFSGAHAAWSNVAASDSPQGDVVLADAPSDYQGALIVPATGSCVNPAGWPGLVDGACTPDGASTAVVHYSGSLLAEPIGEVSADSAQGRARAEFPAASSTFDWSRFDNAFRVWGRWGIAGPWRTGDASVIDLRLQRDASKLRDNTGAVTVRNAPFVDGEPCPIEVHGDRAADNRGTMNGVGPVDTFLLNAIEIVDPTSAGYGAGDHDGLCESGESCLYAPNFGAYQGEGALGRCAYTSGTVTGVTMYGHAVNGG